MTEFSMHEGNENDEARLERLEREFQEREDAARAATEPKAQAMARTSARALFALGLIAGVAASSMLWVEKGVDAYLAGVGADVYRTVSADVPADPIDLLLYVVDEAIVGYSSLVAPRANDGSEAGIDTLLIRCAAAARDALVTPEGAQTLVSPLDGCGSLLQDREGEAPTAGHVAIASLATLASLDSNWLDELMLATWDSGSYMPAHRGLAGIRAISAFLEHRDEGFNEGYPETCAGLAASEMPTCRFENALTLSRNLTLGSGEGLRLEFSTPLGDGAAPYRYAFNVTDFDNAGAYNTPARAYALSKEDVTGQEEIVVAPVPLVTIDRATKPAKAVVTVGEHWESYFLEGELAVLGPRPVGWWPCYEEVVYGFYPKEGAWIERYRTTPRACVGVTYQGTESAAGAQALADSIDDADSVVVVATEAEVAAAKAALGVAIPAHGGDAAGDSAGE